MVNLYVFKGVIEKLLEFYVVEVLFFFIILALYCLRADCILSGLFILLQIGLPNLRNKKAWIDLAQDVVLG